MLLLLLATLATPANAQATPDPDAGATEEAPAEAAIEGAEGETAEPDNEVAGEAIGAAVGEAVGEAPAGAPESAESATTPEPEASEPASEPAAKEPAAAPEPSEPSPEPAAAQGVGEAPSSQPASADSAQGEAAEGEAAEGEAAEGEAAEGEVTPEGEAPEGWSAGGGEAPAEETAEAAAEPEPPPPGAIIGEEIFPEAIDAQLARRYRKLRLRVIDEGNGGWVVRDGQGYVLDTHAFARMTNDPSVEAQLEADRKAGKRNAIIIASVGGAFAASALIPIQLIEEESPPDRQDYFVNPNEFENDLEYQAAQANANARFTLAQGAANTVRGKNEDRRWTSLLLVSTGTLALVGAPFAWEYSVHEQRNLTSYYSREEAERRVAAYNSVVRTRLGMPEPLPPEEPAEGEAAPEESAALTPMPMPPQGVRLEPVVGLGVIGVRGTF